MINAKLCLLQIKSIRAEYLLGGAKLGESKMENILGTLVDHRFSSKTCQAANCKANQILGCIKKMCTQTQVGLDGHMFFLNFT